MDDKYVPESIDYGIPAGMLGQNHTDDVCKPHEKNARTKQNSCSFANYIWRWLQLLMKPCRKPWHLIPLLWDHMHKLNQLYDAFYVISISRWQDVFLWSITSGITWFLWCSEAFRSMILEWKFSYSHGLPGITNCTMGNFLFFLWVIVQPTINFVVYVIQTMLPAYVIFITIRLMIQWQTITCETPGYWRNMSWTMKLCHANILDFTLAKKMSLEIIHEWRSWWHSQCWKVYMQYYLVWCQG